MIAAIVPKFLGIKDNYFTKIVCESSLPNCWLDCSEMGI